VKGWNFIVQARQSPGQVYLICTTSLYSISVGRSSAATNACSTQNALCLAVCKCRVGGACVVNVSANDLWIMLNMGAMEDWSRQLLTSDIYHVELLHIKRVFSNG
jgi:hypothetical protein